MSEQIQISKVPPPDTEWRKSSHSPSDNCVELRVTNGMIEVRDSNNPGGPVIPFTRGDLLAFLQGAKDGEFDDMV